MYEAKVQSGLLQADEHKRYHHVDTNELAASAVADRNGTAESGE
jgi:hypothetical protein